MAEPAAKKENSMIKPTITRIPVIPATVLMIGNSFMYYNNGADSFAAGICRDMGYHIGFTMITIGGGGLNWHPVPCYLHQKAMRSYTPRKDGTLEFHKYERNRIFDCVILQDNSQGPIHPELAENFREAVHDHCKEIRSVDAFPMLLMTWAYEGRPEMTAQLATAITEAANANQAMAIPVGLAFAKALEKDPGIKLTGEDKHHPLPGGTYLEACVISAALTGKSPLGAAFDGIGAARVDKEQAAFLQNIAWETVTEFYGWK